VAAGFGVIGTGHIASVLVTGMCTSETPPSKVLLSPRNATIGARLAERFSAVQVARDNQAVIDGCDRVFLALRTSDVRAALETMRFRKGQQVLSLMAPIDDKWLDAAVAPAGLVSRILLLHSAQLGVGPVAIYPPDDEIARLVAAIGTPVQIAGRDALVAIWSVTALIAPTFNFAASAADWAAARGADPAVARDYAAAMIQSLGTVMSRDGAPTPTELAAGAQTPGGLNEQAMDVLAKCDWFGQIAVALDQVAARLTGDERRDHGAGTLTSMATTVADIMDPNPETVTADTAVETVIGVMRSNELPGIPVINEGRRVVGIVTEADMVLPDDDGDLHLPHYVNIFGGTVFLEPLKRFETRLRKAFASTASDMMTKDPVTVEPSTTVQQAAKIIHDSGHNRLPVVEHGQLVGVVTRVDVLGSLVS